jgi:hypothetical protein
VRVDIHRVFRPFRFDRVNSQLWRGGEALVLRPTTFEVWCFLLDYARPLVTNVALLDAV